jgi:diguanylate cyclase (GGDEF)-like protein
LLFGAAICTALGFASVDRAPLFGARLIGIVLLPAVIALRSTFRPGVGVRRGTRAPLWVGALVVIAAALVQAGGGPGGPLALFAFLCVGAGSLRSGPRRALPWGMILVVAVLLPIWMGWVPAATPLAQAGFFLAVLLCATLPGKTLAAERSSHSQTRALLRTFEDEAGGLRRESTDALPNLRREHYGYEERDRDLRSIARELQLDMDRVCGLLVSGTGASSACVYRPDGFDCSDRLVAVAMAGDTSAILPDVGVRDGIFGAAYMSSSPVSLNSVHDEDPRLAHRRTCASVGATMALPLVDGERRFGVIVLDTADQGGFDDPTRSLAGSIAALVSRLIARAVDLTSTREGMRENHAFYEACREVSRHVRIESIAEAVVRSAGAFMSLDASAVVLVDEHRTSMKVIAEDGFGLPTPYSQIPLDAAEGLLAQCVHHRTVIDRSDLQGSARPPILFGRDHGPTGDLASLLVLPIFPPGEGQAPVQGALVVARRQAPDFDIEDVERLEVLLHQVGAALSNGTLFAEHEARGVTDGMTGLPNHRRFQEVLAGKIASAQRTGLKLSLLLMDIDKFKSVNDNYGHPMGDEVIKRLARCLEGMVREGTDLGARYGGEEFCLLLEGTDGPGARRVAERLREAFAREVFVHKESGQPITFGCTVSIGIACFADDASSQPELIDRADQALYWSKQSGRNRVTLWDMMGDEPTMIDQRVPKLADEDLGY